MGKSLVITFPSYSPQKWLILYLVFPDTVCVGWPLWLIPLQTRKSVMIADCTCLACKISKAPVSVEKTDFIKSFYWRSFGTGRKTVTKLLSCILVLKVI